jgi:predicted DNA-binding protein with PD1-like motif|tara:strand:- start:340 stop:777 length:438 start_codon:yes stop_codon:yes gene_type:complete
MEYIVSGRDVFVRLDPGEEIHESIRSLSKEGIESAAITSGIGRVHDAEVAYLDGNGVYQKTKYSGPVELLSTQGNLCPGPDGPFTHIHIIMCDDDMNVLGGHLFSATVTITAEIHLRILADGVKPSMICRVPGDGDFVKLELRRE